MGDRLRAGIPSRYVTSQLGQLSGLRLANAGSAMLSAYVVAEHRLVDAWTTQREINRRERDYAAVKLRRRLRRRPLLLGASLRAVDKSVSGGRHVVSVRRADVQSDVRVVGLGPILAQHPHD